MFQQKNRFRTGLLAGMAVACLLLAPGSALAKNKGLSMAKTAGLGVGSAVTSLVYGPVKMVYALTGSLVSGIAWAFSGGDKDVAMVVLTPSVMGDYVITPKMLTGQDSVEFFGREPGYESTPEAPPVASAPPETASASESDEDWSSGW